MARAAAVNVADLERQGHARIAEGHAMLAKAAEMRARAPATSDDEWIPVEASPLGKRRTLALARDGKIESAKVPMEDGKTGRKVVVRASSLRAYIDKHVRRHEDSKDEEDLFGANTKSNKRSKAA